MRESGLTPAANPAPMRLSSGSHRVTAIHFMGKLRTGLVSERRRSLAKPKNGGFPRLSKGAGASLPRKCRPAGNTGSA